MWCMFFLAITFKFTLPSVNENVVQVSVENINVLLYLCNKKCL